MRFTINREEFVKGLSLANKSVALKASPFPVLSNLKLELNENGLYITGSNFDLSIKTFIPYKIGDKEVIRNYKEGITLVAADIITNIARKMDNEEIVFEVIDSTTAVISDSKTEYKLQSMRAEEYPDLDLELKNNKLNISRNDFASIVNQTVFAASNKEQRLILTALNIEASNGVLTATATDSARLARKQISIPMEFEFQINISAKVINEINHLTEGVDNINMCVDGKKVYFEFGNTVVSSSLVEGEYPNTKNIVPHFTNYQLDVKSSDIIKAIERANILSVERENIVDLSMNENEVQISAKSSQIGSALDKIEMFKYSGQPLKISFNSEYVLSAIKALGTEDVQLCFIGEMKPFVVKNVSDDSIVQVITPVRTYY